MNDIIIDETDSSYFDLNVGQENVTPAGKHEIRNELILPATLELPAVHRHKSVSIEIQRTFTDALGLSLTFD